MDADHVLRDQDELLFPFLDAETPRARWRVGTEAEKLGVDLDGRPLPYEGERGVAATLEQLVATHGWIPTPEVEGGALIALRRGAASITLEPGAQLELSGAPLDTIHQTCAEFRGHMAELASIAEDLGQVWLGLGFHPLATQAELSWVPKLRYGVMREYLPTRGAHALDMMRRTATVQANYDFSSEDDAMRKLRVAARLQPVATALFANSPWVEGQRTGARTHRGHVWLDVDPDRTGLLPFLWKDAPRYRDYVEWALDAPMFLIKHGKQVLRNTGQTFRAYLKDGFDGVRATMGDWETHLNTLFPEVRLKRTLEVRGTDSQRTALVCALPAMWKGILYDERSLTNAENLVASLGYEELEGARASIADHALDADLAGRPVRAWAEAMVDLARAGLRRLGNLNGTGDDESVHLKPLHRLLDAGRCPADLLLEAVPGPPSVAELFEHAAI